MGLFDFIGSGIKSAGQWLGDRAKDVGTFIGDKVQKALPVVQRIGQGVADVAGKLAPYMPIGGGFVKAIADGGQFVADKIKDGTVNNALEKVKGGLNDFTKLTKTLN